MSLQRGEVLITFTVNGKIQLGSASTAHIRTGSLLGQRVLTLESAGGGTLHPMAVIPVSRTSSPYSLSEAVENLASDIQGTNTETLNQSLDTLSGTLNQIAPQLGPAFDGITRLSQTLNGRNQTLGELLKGAADLTGILSQRSAQLNTLILNADDLLSTLVSRRQAIVRLLSSTSTVAKQLSGLVHDNESKLAPSLEKLNSVTAMLEKNRDNLSKAIPGLAKYEITSGETVSSGFYYNPFIPNLFTLQFFQWLFDYAFGFRAYGAPGQPPDTAGPRAFLPFPFNQNPGGSR
jgi:phospholipid/cholesterol/gamma-HCH transport system substrate-binding protein